MAHEDHLSASRAALPTCKSTTVYHIPDSGTLGLVWNSFVETYAEKRYQIESNNDEMIHNLYRLGNMPGAEDNQLTPPFPSIKNVSELEDYRIQAGKRISNSGHTRKPKEPFTWDQLMTVDKNYTIMAQCMAHRYGYAVNISQDFYNLRQVCGLDDQRRWWGCRLESFDRVEKAQLKTAISLNVEILSRGS